MALIDSRGKLGGVINVFDVAVIIVVLGLLLSGIAAFIGVKKKGTNVPFHSIIKTVTVQTYVVGDIARLIKVKDKELDNCGFALWEIEAIESDEPIAIDVEQRMYATVKDARHEFVLSGADIPLGALINKEERSVPISSLRNMKLRMKMMCRVERDGSLSLVMNNGALARGRPLELRTKDYHIYGTVTDCI